jgi:hypothetical protein
VVGPIICCRRTRTDAEDIVKKKPCTQNSLPGMMHF